MAVFGIVGTIGSGKTLLMTFFALLQHIQGTQIYANYKIIGVNSLSVESIEDILNVDKRAHKIVLLDELWLTADSRNSMSNMAQFCAKSVLQSRKVKSDVYYTTQHLGQIDKRIRDITSLVYLPEIVGYYDNKPVAMNVNICKPNLYGELSIIKKFSIPLMYGDKFVCDLYDTSEIVEEMDNPDNIQTDALIEQYKDFVGTKSKLKSTIIVEGKGKVKESLAGHVANYIL